MIKYLGSKRLLISHIVNAIGEHAPAASSVLDVFSGTSRVGHALKRAGYRVIANDHNAYAATLARCYVQADRESVEQDAAGLVREFNGLRGERGYFTETYCERSRFFRPKNGERVDAIREAIANKCLDPELESVMLVSLMEAADRVDSTTGQQMAYLKAWAPRASKDLELRVPTVLPRATEGKGEAHQLDALRAARNFNADVVYIDPPYNQHSYLGNYHIWESLVKWDKPDVYGVACKRVDCRTRRSDFNSRIRCARAMRQLLKSVRSAVIVVSFSDEGYLSREEMESMLRDIGGEGADLTTRVFDYKRYVGAQIGVYSPAGVKVGAVSHLRNKEFLYVLRRPCVNMDSGERLDSTAPVFHASAAN